MDGPRPSRIVPALVMMSPSGFPWQPPCSFPTACQGESELKSVNQFPLLLQATESRLLLLKGHVEAPTFCTEGILCSKSVNRIAVLAQALSISRTCSRSNSFIQVGQPWNFSECRFLRWEILDQTLNSARTTKAKVSVVSIMAPRRQSRMWSLEGHLTTTGSGMTVCICSGAACSLGPTFSRLQEPCGDNS